ncbi:hypothetical protein FB45DRAFT_427478 [Roridomyces roridus]|uniref:Cytochrome c oxidase assembly protein COX20, mitochondrial n=1 Tax=Roridomyces roridus TaxID=1738132 RepID=A0AAD7C622_9AGAR|nr:hypothetical protein FB45DRAFT_427478 [Roridomyces roridus]
MPDSKPIASGVVDDPANIPAPPTLGPQSTGNLLRDSVNSAMHIGAVPCGRTSLLAGIGAGAGIGFIRGISVHPVVAGSWAMGTFFAVSTASWLSCKWKIEREHELTRKAIQSLPKQLRLKNEGEKEP